MPSTSASVSASSSNLTANSPALGLHVLKPGGSIGGCKLRRLLADAPTRRVFTADDLATNRRVILKLRPSAQFTDLGHEYRILRKCKGEHVVSAEALGVHDRLQLSWLSLSPAGPSMASMVPQLPAPVAESTALELARMAGDALARLHAKSITHGDFKPSNCLLTDGRRVLLTDFEVAQRFDGGRQRNAPNEPEVPGTIAFIAPEVWDDGSMSLSPSADVWALGVSLFWVLCGTYPFGFENPDVVADAAREGSIGLKWPRVCSSEIRTLVARMLHPDPASRPNSRETLIMIEDTLKTLGQEDAARQAVAKAVRENPWWDELRPDAHGAL